MAAANVAAQQARAQYAASQSIIGRNQGPEFYASTNFDPTNVFTWTPNRNIPLNRPVESIIIRLRGRLAVSVANYAAVAPEAPQNLLQSITLQGNHKDIGSFVPVRISGASQYALGGFFQENPADILINGVRAADPGRPFTSPFLGSTAGSPYDIDMFYVLDAGPMMGIGQDLKRQAANFLYHPADWSDSLQITLAFGDRSALGDPTGATTAFTAYGSGAGNWLCEIYLTYAILSQFAGSMRNGLCVRLENTVPSQTALGNSIALATLAKQITTNVIIKTGLIQTVGLSPNVDTFAALSDVQLERTQLVTDSKPVRNSTSNLATKVWYQHRFGTVIPQGYLVESFVDGQNALLAYRGDGLPGSSQWLLNTDVISANAANRQRVIQEYIIGGPYPPLR